MNIRNVFYACAGLLWLSAAGADVPVSAPRQGWTQNFVTRLEALALLQTLNADLLSQPSATLTLEHWCDVHRLASPARIVAVRVPDTDKPPSTEQRQDLAVALDEPIRYRRVRLLCGPLVLSEADNWYVPGRLTPEMNKLLDTTDIPFGKVVQSLHFQRHTLTSKLLWLPLAQGWEMNAPTIGGSGANLPGGAEVPDGVGSPVPSQVLEHRAVLTLPNGTPFSEVVETYTQNVLGFPPP